MVFYRKYRPQLIDDLDSQAVREKLSVVLKNYSTHAFLFTGPKGLGKTSTARIIAKVVNCTERAINQEPRTKNKKEKGKILSSESSVLGGEAIEPCNNCEQCVSITNGTNLDVLEIDAASNRGIDEIRDLKEKIRLSPAAANKKVYIIDEVHMLTTEAFNALLKTLEEPPSHAMFILCTTEPHKVPATITSRCMHIHFNLATDEEIVRSLKRVALGEKLTIDDDAMYAIAKMADGGFRDATKILEELVATNAGNKITKDLVEEKYQVLSIKYQVSSMFDSLVKKDTKSGLDIVQKLVEQGVDMKYFLQVLMIELHGQMLGMVLNQESPQFGGQEGIGNHGFIVDEIRNLFEILSKAYTDMKFAVLPQLPLELAIIEYCQAQDVIARSEATKQSPDEQRIATVASGDLAMTGGESGVTVSSLRKQVGTIKKVQALYGTPPAKQDSSTESAVKTSTIELMHAAPNGDITSEWLDHFWKNIISEIKGYNHTISGVLRGCSIKSFDKKTLVIQTGFKFHKEKLSEVKTLEALEKVCKLLTGKVIEVKVELKV